MEALAAEYAAALHRPVHFVDVPFELWQDELRRRDLPEHVFHHLVTMAKLHAANRYDRLTHDVEKIIGQPAAGVFDFVARHAELFGESRFSR
jgi:NAD(P)H dehydrogenase (quinone)